MSGGNGKGVILGCNLPKGHPGGWKRPIFFQQRPPASAWPNLAGRKKGREGPRASPLPPPARLSGLPCLFGEAKRSLHSKSRLPSASRHPPVSTR